MNNPLNPLMYKEWPLKSHLYTTAGTYYLLLEPGTYEIQVCGGGGAGGSTSAAPYGGGAGGAGAKGDHISETIVLDTPKRVRITVGTGGLTYANGGNGGSSDGSNADTGHSYAKNYIGGFGGGGGQPSFIKIDDTYYVGNGGGGGGGGGATARYGRYGQCGSGGGGGGYYRLNTTTGQIESVPGKIGAKGAGQTDNYGWGTNGLSGNTTDFPDLASGRGGRGDNSVHYGLGAAGGGASGGGAAAGNGNHSGAYGGGGGGGAGGSTDAGGGAGGAGYEAGQNGSNHHTTPTATVDYLGQTVTSGWGIGGATNTNGAPGWIYIKQTSRKPSVLIDDQGLLSDTPITTVDQGELSESEITTENNGEL